MWDIIIGYLSLLVNNSFANSIIGAIISAVVSCLLTLKFVEKRKINRNKKLTLTILYKELIIYCTPKTSLGGFQIPGRKQVIWSILTSDILDTEKDKDLINSLYEMIGWIENFNYVNDYANKTLVENNEMFNFFSKGRDDLYNGSFKERENLLELLRTKYKISIN